jgi:hypothetical protein
MVTGVEKEAYFSRVLMENGERRFPESGPTAGKARLPKTPLVNLKITSLFPPHSTTISTPYHRLSTFSFALNP